MSSMTDSDKNQLFSWSHLRGAVPDLEKPLKRFLYLSGSGSPG